LFPNEIDNKNRIEAGRDVVLPRKAWEIVAVGPPGANHIVAVVSRNERDLRDVGLQHTGEPIPQFDMAVARQRWAQDGGSSFVGKAICPAAPCDAAYGARLIEINVVAPPARARK
jgi:dihydrofolate reductase